MASCDYEAISALVDDELEEAECQQVLNHMSECAECRQIFEWFHTTQNLVRGESRAAPMVGFRERILTAVACEEPSLPSDLDGESIRQPACQKRRWRWVAVAAGAGAIIAVTAFLSSPSHFGFSSTSTSPPVARSSQETASPSVSRQASHSEDEAAIRRYLSVHSSFVSSGRRAEFQRARLEAGGR